MSEINIAVATQCNLTYLGLKKILSDEKSINVTGQVQLPDKLSSQIFSPNPDVLFIHSDIFYLLGVEKIRKVCLSNPGVKIIVFNVRPHEEGVMLRFLKAGVRGIIYMNEAPSVYARAVRKVCKGEMWIKRKTVLKLINSRQNNRIKTPKIKLARLLTPRENVILNLIAAGKRNLAIAEKLCISEHTVKFHIQNIFRKLEVRSRGEAALYCLPD